VRALRDIGSVLVLPSMILADSGADHVIYRFDHSKRTLVSATVILAKQFWKTFSKDRSLCFLFSGRLQLFCNGLAFAAVLGKRVGSPPHYSQKSLNLSGLNSV